MKYRDLQRIPYSRLSKLLEDGDVPVTIEGKEVFIIHSTVKANQSQILKTLQKPVTRNTSLPDSTVKIDADGNIIPW